MVAVVTASQSMSDRTAKLWIPQRMERVQLATPRRGLMNPPAAGHSGGGDADAPGNTEPVGKHAEAGAPCR